LAQPLHGVPTHHPDRTCGGRAGPAPFRGDGTRRIVSRAVTTLELRPTESVAAGTRFGFSSFEAIVGTAAFLAATIAVWLTLRADFLAHPGWLAVQKADFILGPVLTGLYWRPRSRFWPLLLAA
jgi:hypothetical protein